MFKRGDVVMCTKLTECENWDEMLDLIARLTSENKQLKEEKQVLISENMNLKLQIQQEQRRTKLAYGTLISEMGGKYG